MSQKQRNPSFLPPVTSVFPSELNARAITGSTCLRSTRSSFGGLAITFHTAMPPSNLLVASVLPSGLNATAMKPLGC
jgi:hypothetical protein